MAPAIHPSCTPAASCVPMRCHPTPPPCKDPVKCLATTTRKNLRPCRSAVSILATKSSSRCSNRNYSKNRTATKVEKFLRKKDKEARLKEADKLRGTHKFERYIRRQGKYRPSRECCAGKGHRGRLKERMRCCTIL